jgi:hypothetical protein
MSRHYIEAVKEKQLRAVGVVTCAPANAGLTSVLCRFDLLLHVVHHCPQLMEHRGQDRLYSIQHELRSPAIFLNATVRAEYNKASITTVKASK